MEGIIEQNQAEENDSSMSLKKGFAEVVSSILHPIVVPIVAYWYMLEKHFPQNPDKYLYLGMIFLVFSLVPTIMVVALKKSGKITDLDISKRSQRLMPLSIAVTAYFIGFLFLKALDSPQIISGLFLFYSINTMLLMVVTYKWKISVHLSSYTAPVAVLYVMFGEIALLLLILTPLLMWSRVYLKAHTFMQTLTGSVMGFLLLYIEVLVWFRLFPEK